MSFEEWYDQHFGSKEDKAAAVASAATAEIDPERLDYAPDNDTVQRAVGSVLQSVRDAPGWATRRIARGINPDLPSPPNRWDESPFLDPNNWSARNVVPNLKSLWRTTGEGPSAREQEAAMPAPPVPRDWSLQRAIDHFSKQIPELLNDLKQQVRPTRPMAGGGADSNINRRLWEYQEPVEQLKTQALSPDFAPDLPMMARYPGVGGQPRPAPSPEPLPSPPYVGENMAGRALKGVFNELRQGVLPDEAIAEIKRDPTSLDSIGAYVNAAISLSGGKGGERIPLGPKGAVPEHIWQSWKIPNPDKPTIRVDNAGNHFEMTGIHKVGEPGDPGHTWHAIVQPVEPPIEPPGPTESGELWHDNPFQKFLDKIYPQGTSGQFKDPTTLPPGELSKGQSSDNPFGISNEEMNQLKKEFHDEKAPFEPLPEMGSSMWDEWAKKHGGLKPDFDTHTPKEFPEGQPGSPTHYDEWLKGKDFGGKSQEEIDDAYWQDVQAEMREYDKEWLDKLSNSMPDFQVQPDMSVDPLNPNQLPTNPRNHLYWSDLYQKMLPFDQPPPIGRWQYKPPPPE